MAWLRRFLDQVWPTLEGSETEELPFESPRALDELRLNCTVRGDDAIEVLLIELRNLFNEEEGRRSRVDAKAGGMLAAIGLSVSLASGVLFAALRLEFSTPHFKDAVLVAFVCALVSVVYLAAAAYHTLRALERAAHSALGPEELLGWKNDRAPELRRRIAIEYGLCTIRNRSVINRKVDHVHMAQLFIRNAVGSVVLVVFSSMAVVSVAPVHNAAPCPPCPSAIARNPSGSAPSVLPSAASAIPAAPASLSSALPSASSVVAAAPRTSRAVQPKPPASLASSGAARAHRGPP